MDYTQKMENLIWKFNGEDVDVEDIQAFLSRPEEFYSFGDNLSRIIRRKMPAGLTETPGQFLLRRCKETGLAINRNTVSNWLSKGLRPKRSDESRENMFKVAFALGLSKEETDELFHHVYLDRSFNFRRENEFIYYYCIKAGKTYQHAQALLNLLHKGENVDPPAEEQTIATKMIGSALGFLLEDEDILQYIKKHPHNFEINNRAAIEKLNEWKEKAEKTAREESERKENEAKEKQKKNKRKDTKDKKSIFQIITGQSFSKNLDENNTGTISWTGRLQLIKEIKANFPQPQTLSKLSVNMGEELTYDEIRKLIIFFYSYWYWEQTEAQKGEVDFDEFEDGLSSLLNDINFPTLYYGNPHDWFYLYCATTEYPLDTFRGILAEAYLAEALNEEE